MNRSAVVVAAATALMLSACTWSSAPAEPSGESSSSFSSLTSENRSYQGIVEEAGVSIYMQGSHRLRLADDAFILLESDDVDLDAFVGDEVEVFGPTRATVESNGRIMNVQEITVLSAEDVSSESSMSSVASSEESSVASSTASSAVSVAASSRSSVTSVAASSRMSVASVASAAPSSAASDVEIRAQAMAGANMAPSNWTREYCTPHIGFCFPVHKNWYFKSFGATVSALWHVEVSNQEILSLNESPIAVNLYSGSVAAKEATDGQVRVEGGTVIGFKEWTDNNHFEISAPASLEAAVRIMIGGVRVLETSSASSQ